jgi:hypothetical protein
MSGECEPGTPAATPPADWPVLTPRELRVLGVLVEKSQTTPDAYPLTLNSLTTGCNQKSNRDPVLNLAEADVEEALSSLQKKELVMRVTSSGRTERWRHRLYDQWSLEKVELAILAELMLRGAQTEGELRGRASRMEPIADLDTLRNLLRALEQRKLIVWLGEEGRRGSTLTHGFHDRSELASLRGRPTAPAAPSAPAAPRQRPTDSDVAELRSQLADLQNIVKDLQSAVERLTRDVRQLSRPVGEPGA